MWEDGASFEWLMINYAGQDFPPGIGPLGPSDVLPSLFHNATFVTNIPEANDSVT